MALPAIQDRLAVLPHAVSIGKYQIPTGVMRSADIDPGRKVVRIWCGEGAMGHDGEVILDFHLLTSSRVKTFVKGLLNQTGAYLLSIDQLTARVSQNGGASVFRAEFTLPNRKSAEIFCDHAAPLYFPDLPHILNGRIVRIFTKPGDERDIISRMKQAFSSLNVHTNNTLQEALSRDPQAAFQVDPLPRFMGDEVCSFRQPPLYAISPILVRKEIHSQLEPLRFNQKTAEEFGKRLVVLMERLRFKLESSPLNDLVKQTLARPPQDEVEIETVKNRIRCYLETIEPDFPEVRILIEGLLT